MANREMGEVGFEVDGVYYVLRLDCNALIAAQHEAGIHDDFDLFVRLRTVHRRLPLLRACYFEAIRIGKNRERFAAKEKAGDLITRLGAEQAAAFVWEGLVWFLPTEEPRKEGETTEPPPSDGPTST